MQSEKLWIVFLTFLLFSFIGTNQAFAGDVVINEFLANPHKGEKEWVEFYNPSNIDISNYWIDDDTDFSSDTRNSLKKELTSLEPSNPTFPFFTLSTSYMFNDKCNPACDYVVLFSSDGTLVDHYQYSPEQIDQDGKSIGRSPDGSNNWVVLEQTTKGAVNSLADPTPTSTPIPTSTPTKTPTPTPTTQPTPTERPTPTPKVPTPTKTPTPTKIPTPTVKPNSTSDSTSKSTIPLVYSSNEQLVGDGDEVFPTSILGESTESATDDISSTDKLEIKTSPSVKGTKNLGSSQNNFSKILIGVGVIFLIACGILAFRSYIKSRKENEFSG